MDIKEELFKLQDEKFSDFNSRLIPGVDRKKVIGVKTPELKKLAKIIVKENIADDFLQQLPHKYFEENQLHAFIVSDIKDYDMALSEIERFLPYIDNWATCDQLIPKAIAKNPERVLIKADEWLESEHTYTVRFAIGIYMRYFLDDRFKKDYLYKIASLKSEEYYVNMMIAWYFATALAKQYDTTISVFEKRLLDKWTYNRAIQKARESYRVSDEHKEVLKGMKI